MEDKGKTMMHLIVSFDTTDIGDSFPALADGIEQCGNIDHMDYKLHENTAVFFADTSLTMTAITSKLYSNEVCAKRIKAMAYRMLAPRHPQCNAHLNAKVLDAKP